MTVKAIINLEQFATDDTIGSIRDLDIVADSVISVTGSKFAGQGDYTQGHLPAIINPTAAIGKQGFSTPNSDDWSDSPTFQPNLLYRYRFGFGRDKLEFPNISPGSPGSGWGNLDEQHGTIITQVNYAINSDGRVRDINHQGTTRVDQYVTSDSSGDLSQMRHIAGATGEVTIEEFPFILLAVPAPFSIKNPVDTDVFIRLANFANPIASGTINLFLDGTNIPALEVVEFFGGLGGFDVTWNNVSLFDYDDTVQVRWEFFDTDSPANKVVIVYPFDTISDLLRPRIQSIFPIDTAVGIPITGPIQFNLLDFENDVDITTLKLYVNNVLIVDGVNGTITSTRLSTDNGYKIVFTPTENLLYGDLIPVAIFVKDTSISKNELFHTFSFTTLESIAPRIINLDPNACKTQVKLSTDVKLSVIDGGHGLQEDSIIISVKETEREVQLIPIVHRDD